MKDIIEPILSRIGSQLEFLTICDGAMQVDSDLSRVLVRWQAPELCVVRALAWGFVQSALRIRLQLLDFAEQFPNLAAKVARYRLL